MLDVVLLILIGSGKLHVSHVSHGDASMLMRRWLCLGKPTVARLVRLLNSTKSEQYFILFYFGYIGELNSSLQGN